MTAKKFFSFIYIFAFLVILFCDIAPMVMEISIPSMVVPIARVVLIVALVLSLGFKGFVGMLISLVIMYVLYVLITGGLMLLGLTYELADIIGTLAAIVFILVVPSKF